MRQVVQHVLTGCGRLDYCGSHPGTPTLGLLLIAGWIGTGQVVGGIVLAAVFLPLYLVGAYERSRFDEQIKHR